MPAWTPDELDRFGDSEEVESAAANTRATIDDAYRAKYARYAGNYLPPILTDTAVAATVRLSPAD